ncbi:MAG: GNAT family N-acetyltransferase [Bacteriovoracia bacterium]
MQVRWQWGKFDDFSNREFYAALRLRQEVFVVEQKCAYLDSDGKDPASWHLLGWIPAAPEMLAAYLRVTPPGVRFSEYSIGRVVSSPALRGQGYGMAIMREALARIEREFGPQPLRISAQAYLEKFYGGLGFRTVNPEPYLEDDIPHLEMLRP